MGPMTLQFIRKYFEGKTFYVNERDFYKVHKVYISIGDDGVPFFRVTTSRYWRLPYYEVESRISRHMREYFLNQNVRVDTV